MTLGAIRPTDTDGSSTEATPQNTDAAATNTSDATIHRSRSEERVRTTTLIHHVQPAITQKSMAAGGRRTGSAHRTTSPRGNCCPAWTSRASAGC
ncbi:hypothetical protein [Streptomyces sp. NPDC048473]|uniref:hypothetical protein n=1 Tax=unclassified Streptomyces TaxID=2593676 RepID=UPI00372308E1